MVGEKNYINSQNCMSEWVIKASMQWCCEQKSSISGDTIYFPLNIMFRKTCNIFSTEQKTHYKGMQFLELIFKHLQKYLCVHFGSSVIFIWYLVFIGLFSS